MQRILIRHLSGAHANQVQEFLASESPEILIGRDLDAAIRFDPNDDLVSRQHTKIFRDPESPAHFSVVDLQSRNGTFVNRQRIYGPTRLAHQDLIQLGPAGPEFRFEMDPPPIGAPPPRLDDTADIKPARLADTSIGSSFKPLGLAPSLPPSPSTRETSTALDNRPVGRATVVRILGDAFGRVEHETSKAVWMGAAVMAALIVVSIGAYIYLRRNAQDAAQQSQQNSQMISQVGQDLKKTPEAAETVRQEVLRLRSELQSAEQRNADQMRSLGKLVKEQTAAIAAGNAVRDAQIQPPVPPQTTSPPKLAGPPPTAAAAADAPPPAAAAPKTDYETGVNRAVDYLQNNDWASAERLVQVLITAEPNRWQAYSVAGSMAKLEGNLPRAKLMFEKAWSLAPDEVKPGLRDAIRQVSGQ